jgi:HD-GYP domain-containing protein (c-di-GMP phosphodiesterase class II)
LKDNDIPLTSRIFAIVDAWDALNSDRPYRKAWPSEKVIDYIQQNAGKMFDPDIVGIFLKMDKS